MVYVDFSPTSGIDPSHQSEISSVLSTLTGCPDEGEQSSAIQGIRSVKVLRRIAGGRSGSEVLEIETVHEMGTDLQVAKLDCESTASQEWIRYRKVKAPSTLYAPIVALSEGVLTPDKALEHERQAVVYQHVSQFDASRPADEPEVRPLEDIVKAGLTGTADEAEIASSAVRTLMTGLVKALYGGCRRSPAEDTLRTANEKLGCDLELEFDQVTLSDRAARLRDGNPGEKDLDEKRVHENDVLRSSTAPPGPQRIQPDERVRITITDFQIVSDWEITAALGAVRLRLAATGGAADSSLSGQVGSRRVLDVYGRVVRTRSTRVADLITDKLGDLEGFLQDGVSLTLGRARVAHPFSWLHAVLADSPAENRAVSRTHGDLNPRNVIFSGSRPFLIDYANAEREGALLADPAWLEVCLLRDAIAPVLPWEDLVRLQRFLGLLSIMVAPRSIVPAASFDEVVSKLADLLEQGSPALGRALRLLWPVRSAALDAMPAEMQARFGPQMLQYLTLAACRTLKWPNDEQNAATVQAACAVAGVCSEFMRASGQEWKSWWSRQDLDLLCQLLLPQAETVKLLPIEAVSDLLCSLLESAEQGDLGTVEIDVEALTAQVVRQLAGATTEKCFEISESLTLREYIALEARELGADDSLTRGYGALAVARNGLDLLAEHRLAVLVGESGSGKTTLVREFQRLMLARVMTPSSVSRDVPVPTCLPLTVSALALCEHIGSAHDDPLVALAAVCVPLDGLPAAAMRRLFDLGAVHVTIEDLHKVTPDARPKLYEWIRSLPLQLPRARFLLALRVADYSERQVDWPAIALLKVRKEQATQFIADVLRRTDPADWKALAADFERRLFDGEDAALRDLACSPQFLRTTIEAFATTKEFPASPFVALRHMFDDLLTGAGAFDGTTRMVWCERLAQVMAERGEAVEYGEAVEIIADRFPGRASQAIDDLVACGILRREGKWVFFHSPQFQTYCAASALKHAAEKDLEDVLPLITQFCWREPAQLLLADPDTPSDVALAMVRVAVAASPAYGAWLLKAAKVEAADLRTQFLQQQRQALCNIERGDQAREEAAYALARYGDREAVQILQSVATDPDSDPKSARLALDGLVMMHKWFAPGASQALEHVVQHVLDQVPEAPDDLVETALLSIARARFWRLCGHAVSCLLAPSSSWIVAHAAWTALQRLGIKQSRWARRAYAEACAHRLEAISRELPECTSSEAAVELNEQRVQLLAALAVEGRVEVLLEHRFRAGVVECPLWDTMLNTAAGIREDRSPQDVLAQHLLAPADQDAEQRWRDLLAGDNEYLAAIGAHRLLSAKRAVRVTELEAVAESASPTRLLVVAAFVHRLAPGDLASVEGIVSRLLSPLQVPYLEAVSNLVYAAGTVDPRMRTRLALRVQRALSEHGPEVALRWPWCSAWRQSIPDPSEVDSFLQSTEDAEDALLVLSSVDVLLDAPAAVPQLLTLDTQAALARLRPDHADGMPAHRFAMLAASAGLYDMIGFVTEVATSAANLRQTVTHAHSQHGLVEVCLAAPAITAIGYLTRVAWKDGQYPDVNRTYAQLVRLGMEQAGVHPSLERARLIGLGFLGAWQELLSSLTDDDPILARAAIGIISHHLPGPLTQEGDQCFAFIAKWIADQLNTGRLPTTVQATLAEIRDDIHSRLESYAC